MGLTGSIAGTIQEFEMERAILCGFGSATSIFDRVSKLVQGLASVWG